MKIRMLWRFIFLVGFIFMIEGQGGITSYQEKKQSKESLNFKAEKAKEKKCPRGGCYEGPPIDEDYPLYVFISFSMPEASLLSLSKELETYGGAFVIRGLPNNSFAQFFDKLNHLKERGMESPVLIDPDNFEEYEVEQVPTIVLKSEENFDIVQGNVPVAYALEIFAEKGDTKRLAKKIHHTSINTNKQRLLGTQSNRGLQSIHEQKRSRSMQ